MMRALLSGCVLFALVALLIPAWAGEAQKAKRLAVVKKVLDDAKITLEEAMTTAQKKVPEGKLLVARTEQDETKSKFGFYFLVGNKVQEVELDVVSGDILKNEEKKNVEKSKKLVNAKKALKGAKVSFKQALEIAGNKVKGGKPFEVEMELDGDRAIVEVEFLVGGKISRVRIDARDATKVEVVD